MAGIHSQRVSSYIRFRHQKPGASVSMTEFLKGRGFEKWFAELGVTDAPVTRRGLATTLQFFHDHMPSLKRKAQLEYLTGIDLHRPVERLTLERGDVVAAYRKHNEDPF